MKKETNKPIESFSLRGVTASVFRNTSKDGQPYYKTSIVRSFKDGEQIKFSSVFGVDDLPIVETLARKCFISTLNFQKSDSKES